MNKKIALYLALLLPIIFVWFIMLLYWVPRFFISPSYDFVYFHQTRNTKSTFNVQDWAIVINSLNYREVEWYKDYPDLYVHNTKTNTSRQITFEEAEKLFISPNDTSPDWFRFNRSYSSIWVFPFYSSSNNRVFLTSNWANYRQNINLDYWSVSFLWWIVDQSEWNEIKNNPSLKKDLNWDNITAEKTRIYLETEENIDFEEKDNFINENWFDEINIDDDSSNIFESTELEVNDSDLDLKIND